MHWKGQEPGGLSQERSGSGRKFATRFVAVAVGYKCGLQDAVRGWERAAIAHGLGPREDVWDVPSMHPWVWMWLRKDRTLIHCLLANRYQKAAQNRICLEGPYGTGAPLQKKQRPALCERVACHQYHFLLSVASLRGELPMPPRCTFSPMCLGTTLRTNHPLVSRHFSCGTIFSTELGFSWLRWMQGSYSGMQDNILCVLHGNTCIWNAN